MNTGLKLKENEIVHCKTEKQAKKVLKLASKMGLKWIIGDSLLEDNFWYIYKENTCYDLNKGHYRKIDDLKEYIIISSEEFLKRHKKENLKQRIEKLEAERDHSKKQCELILNNVENKILNYLDHAKKQDERISKLEQQEKLIEELHADIKIGDVVKAWDRDENKFVFGVISRIDGDDIPYKLEVGYWYPNAEKAPAEVVKHFKK